MSADTNPPSQSANFVEGTRPAKYWYDWAVRIAKRLRDTEALAQSAVDAAGGAAPTHIPGVQGVPGEVQVYGSAETDWLIGLDPALATRSGGTTIIVQEEHYEESWPIVPQQSASAGSGITALTGDVTASGTGSVAATLTAQAIADKTTASTGKTTPVDGDELPLVDSAAGNAIKKLTWANLKATLKAYFDTLYATASSGAWTTIKKTSDQTRTGTITLADDSTLVLAMAAGTRYELRLRVKYTTTAAGDFRYGWAYSGSTTSVFAVLQVMVPAGSLSTVAENTLRTNNTLSGAAGVGFHYLDLTILTNTSGTFSFQWAQAVSDPGNTIVHAGSYMDWMTV